MIAPLPEPAPPPVDVEPFFSGGDWVTLGVGLVAAVLAFLTWRASARSARAAEASAEAAKRAAKAGEDAAAEQRRANDLTEAKARQEDTQRAEARAAAEEAARRAARKIVVQYGLNAGLDVVITNNSDWTVHNLRLVDVIVDGRPGWTWRRNPAIFGGPQIHAARLDPRAEHPIPIVFEDERGKRQGPTSDLGYGALVRFTDRHDTRWEIGDDAGPRRVPADDSDLATS